MAKKDAGDKETGKGDGKKEAIKAEAITRSAKPKIPEGGDANLERRKEWFEKRQGQS